MQKKKYEQFSVSIKPCPLENCWHQQSGAMWKYIKHQQRFHRRFNLINCTCAHPFLCHNNKRAPSCGAFFYIGLQNASKLSTLFTNISLCSFSSTAFIPTACLSNAREITANCIHTKHSAFNSQFNFTRQYDPKNSPIPVIVCLRFNLSRAQQVRTK